MEETGLSAFNFGRMRKGEFSGMIILKPLGVERNDL